MRHGARQPPAAGPGEIAFSLAGQAAALIDQAQQLIAEWEAML